MDENFQDLLNQNKKPERLKPGTLLEGEVVEIREGAVVVNAGLKSEGVIPIEQFTNKNGELEVSEGDIVEVALDSLEDGLGETLLSRERARNIRTWTRLEEACESGDIVKGFLLNKVKGGFIVDLDGISAFLPGSLVDMRPMRDLTYLEGKELEFKIIKLDRNRSNVVVSRRAVLESEHGAGADEMKNLSEGMVVKGIVKNLTDYGAFLGFGSFDGLLHITDMAWKRVHHPSEVLAVGDEIEVKILRYDKEKNRISLGLKQMTEDPWTQLVRRCPVKSRVFGKVTSITDYGCFIEIEEGVEGLAHISELDWTNKNISPSRVVSVGQQVEAMVIDVDEDKRRVSLSLKKCKDNPWNEFSSNQRKGDRLKGVVRSINDFGIFVGFTDYGIDGLVHITDISVTEPPDEAIRRYKKGQQVEVVVLSVDPGRERISLGIKQLNDSHLHDYLGKHPKNSAVTGTVVAVTDKSVIVNLADNVHGVIPVSEVSQDGAPKAGDSVEAKLTGHDKKNCVLSLSVKAKEKEEQAVKVRQYAAAEKPAGTSLGDLFREKLRRIKVGGRKGAGDKSG